jgi:phage-related protein
MTGKGTVGKLSVKVVPDLSDFAKKLRRDLERIQKQVKDLDIEFNAEVELNKESLEKARKEAAKSDVRFKAEVDLKKGELEALRKKIQHIKSEIKVNANLSEEQKKKLQEKLDNIRTNINLSTRPGDLAKLKRDVQSAAGDVKAGLTVNERALRQVQARINKLKADIPAKAKLDSAAEKELKARLAAIKADVDVHAKLSEEQKKKIKHELSKLDGKATVNADLDDGKARFDLKRLTHSRWVTINVRLGKASMARALAQLKALAGGNVFESLGRNLNDFLRNLDTAAVKMGAVSTLIGGAVSAVGSGLGVFSSLAVGLAKSTPALLALPGIFGAAAAGAGVLIAALKDAKTVLADLGPAFTGLQQQISGAYWEQAAQPMRDFANIAINELSPVLQSVASNLGSMTAAIANAASGHIAGFQQSLTYLSQALSLGSTGAASFTNGLLTMGEVGAKFLPSIAQWANNLAASFEQWATKAASSGRMEESIRAAAKAFGTMKDVTVDLGGIIGGLFRAMANGSAPIDSIATALDRANAAVNGPLFQATLSNLFSAMGQAAGLAFRGVGSLGEAFVSLEPTLGKVIPLIGGTLQTALQGIAAALENPAFQDGLVNFFNGVLTAVQALAPAMPALGEAFGAIATVAGTLLAAIAPLVAQLVEGLAPIFQQLVPILTPVIEQLSAALLPVIQSLVPVIAEIIAQLAPIIAELLPQVLPVLSSIIQQLAAALIPAIQLVGKVLQWLLPVVITIWQSISTSISGAITAIKGVIQVVLGLITGNWSQAWEGIKNIGRGIWTFIQGQFGVFANAIVNIAKSAWNWIVQTVSSAWQSIVSYVNTGINNAKSYISNGWNAALNATRSIWLTIVNTVSTWINNAINYVRQMPTSIKNVFSGAGSWLWNAGKNVIQGFINGLKSMFSSVQSSLSSLTSLLPSWKGPAPVDKVILKDAGQLVMKGFISGLESQYGAVRKSLQGFTEDLANDVSPDIAASVSTSFEKAKPSRKSLDQLASLTPAPGDQRSGGTVNITNYYPQAQRDSKVRDDVADGIRLASSI